MDSDRSTEALFKELAAAIERRDLQKATKLLVQVERSLAEDQRSMAMGLATRSENGRSRRGRNKRST